MQSTETENKHSTLTDKTGDSIAPISDLPHLDLLIWARQRQDELEAFQADKQTAHHERAKQLTKQLVLKMDQLLGEKYRKGLALPNHVRFGGNYQHFYFALATTVNWLFESPPTKTKEKLAKHLCQEFIYSEEYEFGFTIMPSGLVMHQATMLHAAALHLAKLAIPEFQYVFLGSFDQYTHVVPIVLDKHSVQLLLDWSET